VALSLIDLPTDRALYLDGASPEAIALSVEPLPDGAPAIVTYSPRVGEALSSPTSPGAAQSATSTARSQAAIVAEILQELDRAAMQLYPAWLPEAAGIKSPAGAGIAAVRAVALRLAAHSHHFGPFVADLASRSLRGDAARSSLFAPEVRAAGLARVIAASFGRPRAALLVVVPDGLVADEQRALATACDWLADHGHIGAWLSGARLTAVDWLESVTLSLPSGLVGLPEQSEDGRDRPVVTYPPLAGRPHPGSRVEQLLEASLAPRPWASGRCWNRTISLHPLANPVQPDLVWDDARCVVEIDGDDHLGRQKYARDRTRDVDLQLAGYAVLRFTNAQVLTDIEAMLAKLERFLADRRLQFTEGRPHGG
jgi:Protein of unknown function (DUF559)